MRVRSRLVTVTIGISAVLGLAMASNAAADHGQPAGGSRTVTGADSTILDANPPSIIQGWDNINFGHDMIVHLMAGPCNDSDDVDYAIVDLGNNNDRLASIQLNPASNCTLILYDGQNFTGDSVRIPKGTGGCANLGSCFGHNLWNRVESLKLL